MTRTPRAPHSSLLLAAPLLAALAFAACRSQEPRVSSVHARGVQVYRWDVAANGSPSWKFVGPRADLYDAAERKIGTHAKGDAGPEWSIGTDRVIGTKLWERPSPNAGAIPELLLSARTAGDGSVFDGVRRIERVETEGGAAPPVEGPHHAGDEVEVPYRAKYLFLTECP
jgi:hypothetical protein